MTCRFTIEADPHQCLLRVKLSGYFNAEDVSDYAREREAALDRLRCRPGTHLVLMDVREGLVQSQEVIAAFAGAVNHLRAPRRLAFVTHSALIRRQLQRLAYGDRANFFEDEAAALSWLNEPSIEAP